MTSANENLPAGMGGLKYPVSQVSLVVNDLHHTMERYYEAFGWTGWRVFDHVEPMHHGTQLRGKPVPYSLRGAEVIVGDLNFVNTLPKTRSGKIMRRVLKAVTLDTDPGDISTIEDEGSVEDARQAWEQMRQGVSTTAT